MRTSTDTRASCPPSPPFPVGSASRRIQCWPDAVADRLGRSVAAAKAVERADWGDAAPSVVLFPLIPSRQGGGDREPCLLLTKRSHRVRQPGDLCCPGGGISEGLDRVLGRLLCLPSTPLTRWEEWRRHRRRHGTGQLPTLLAAGLREAFEEMRLNPFNTRFLGILPPQELVMFRRVILPLVVWIRRPQRFRPNWEVDRLVSIPMGRLLAPDAYACYRLAFEDGGPRGHGHRTVDFPCFVHRGEREEEILWGATFRIAMAFLDRVFDFSPPPLGGLRVIRNRLGRDYRTGAGG